ncbi:hypothetical protein BDK51DRAFT_40927 [Blyttiomyces helicus]|uniref:Uncharacterized protein n=1 Tax=Blyttiomyces helicus TaxID=388810 RepID=A0A4P9WA54_9FUNG|nr:hypothetical protein BDK51DRAFT_40927 [Blyttiomyces helicus]|eukprot:RKO89459.1 hypothetical protein BDK51DRAFT_40927 [Blyttiomyces helicus]
MPQKRVASNDDFGGVKQPGAAIVVGEGWMATECGVRPAKIVILHPVMDLSRVPLECAFFWRSFLFVSPTSKKRSAHHKRRTSIADTVKGKRRAQGLAYFSPSVSTPVKLARFPPRPTGTKMPLAVTINDLVTRNSRRKVYRSDLENAFVRVSFHREGFSPSHLWLEHAATSAYTYAQVSFEVRVDSSISFLEPTFSYRKSADLQFYKDWWNGDLDLCRNMFSEDVRHFRRRVVYRCSLHSETERGPKDRGLLLCAGTTLGGEVHSF